MPKKIRFAILLVGITAILILFLALPDDNTILYDTFEVDAIYYESGDVQVTFLDKSQNTESVVLEVLGMDESFQRVFSSSKFIEIIQFPNPSKYGWKVHPVVFDVKHADFGDLQIKTEIRSAGEPAPTVIYSYQ